ncbi:MAG: hypothetical protein JWM80_1167 [Cyanobacteria bacterium RYN_339]|nr:hypothetical protein [Cyanobacteria bacterium RYN_339]
MLSPVTIGVAAVVAIIVFGPQKLPQLARESGRAIQEFRKAVSGQPEA